MERTRKKQNIFVRYFKPFGLRQVCDILMLVGLVLLIVGLFNMKPVLIAAFICYVIGALGSIVRCVLIMHRSKNKRDPERKAAVVNLAVMAVLFALAVFGLVWAFVGPY